MATAGQNMEFRQIQRKFRHWLMEFPLDKETMRSFLGVINYLNRYSALSAHLTAPLSAITHQATDYKPAKVHFENFNQLKVEISNMKALPYFYVNAETTLQMDASKKGLRACLIQKGKVMFCFQGPRQDWAELPEFGMRGIGNYLGNGKVPLLPEWKGIYIGNWPEATCKYLQKTYDWH